MAETIRGISVQIGADTTGLSKALSDVNKRSRDIQSELKQVEKLLKLDPGNTELLAQKQKLLSDAITNTSQKLNTLRTAQQQVNEQFARGEISEGQYRAFQRELTKTEQELKRMDGQLDETTKSLKEQGVVVSQLGKDYQESFEQAQQSLGNSFEQMKKVGAGVTAVGAGIAAGLGVAVSKAADFEQGMANAFSVMAPEEVSEFSDELKKLAITMGADTKYSATEAAQGIEELIKAGVSIQDVLSGGLDGALSLATAGELELADAAEIASTALNAFKADAISVNDAADILAGAANASATSVGELKFSLSAVSSVASGVGLSFEDTTTALALFAQNGLKGSDAGTSLKTMLMRLTPTTDAAAAEFDKLGLYSFNAQKAMDYLVSNGVTPVSSATKDVVDAMMTYSAELDGVKVGSAKANKAFNEMAFSSGAMSSEFYDANGNLKSMAEIADILQNSLKDMTAEQRQVSLNTLFGSDAIRGANILFKEGANGINSMAEAMGKISAADVAAQKLNTFKGAMEELGGSVETAQISLGTALLPALDMLAKLVQGLVDGFNSLSPSVQSFIAIAGAITAVLALIIGPLTLLVGFLPQIAAGFTMLGPAISVVTGPIGIVIAAVAALAAGLTYLYNNNETVKNGLNVAWTFLKTTATNIFNAIKNIFKTVFDAISQIVKRVFDDLKSFWAKWGGTITEAFKNVLEILKIAFKAAFDAIASIVKTIFNGIKAFWDTWGTTIKGLFTTSLNVVKSIFTGTWNAIKITIETTIGVISGVIKAFLAVLKGDWKGAWDAVKGIAESIWNGIKNMFSNVGETMKTIGKDIMQGLINGIKDMADAVWNSAKDVAAKIKNGFKDFFGIKSPSRLMMGYGEYISEGLAIGIADAGRLAVKSAESLSGAVSKAMHVDPVGLSVASSSAMTGSQGSAQTGGVVNQYNMEGLFKGANINIRNDDDIRRLGQEFQGIIRGNSRGLGGVAT
jgi:phage-related minor tail protein